MKTMTIRKIPESVHRGLRERAQRNNRSVQQEVLRLICTNVERSSNVHMGQALARLGRPEDISGEQTS